MPLPDCGELLVMPSEQDASGVVVRLDGAEIARLAAPLPRDGARVPLHACGVHELDVRWSPDDPPAPRVAVLGAGVEIRAHRARAWDARGGTGPRCLALDPPTFGWSCDARPVAPGAPFDLATCGGAGGGGEKPLSAVAKNEPPLRLALLPALPGTYTASVRDGRIAIAWTAGAEGCASAPGR